MSAAAKKRTPPPPRRGKRTKSTARHFRVGNVNLGDGKLVIVKLTIDRAGVLVRKVGSRRKWFVSMHEAAGMLARRGQADYVAKRFTTCQHLVRSKSTGACEDCGKPLRPTVAIDEALRGIRHPGVSSGGMDW